MIDWLPIYQKEFNKAVSVNMGIVIFFVCDRFRQ